MDPVSTRYKAENITHTHTQIIKKILVTIKIVIIMIIMFTLIVEAVFYFIFLYTEFILTFQRQGKATKRSFLNIITKNCIFITNFHKITTAILMLMRVIIIRFNFDH